MEALEHYQKETPTQEFSCKVCEIFKNNFSYRTPPVAASGDNKSYTRLFSLNKKTFPSQRVTFLKQPIMNNFIDDKNKGHTGKSGPGTLVGSYKNRKTGISVGLWKNLKRGTCSGA